MSESAAPVIHPSAIVAKSVRLGAGIRIGPCCVIEGDVTLDDHVHLIAQCYITGPTTIGAGTTISPGACIGLLPQDYKFKLGAPTAGVKIGKDCLIREHATVHAASKLDHPTTVGDGCFLMVNTHLGHDTVIGNNVILVNGALLAGHASVGNNATLSGNAMVHQFGRVGRLAFVSGGVPMVMDTPPFCIAGARNTVIGLNHVGLRRFGVPREEITMLRKAFREAYRERSPKAEIIARLEPLALQSVYVAEFRDFFKSSTRSVAGARITRDDRHEQDEERSCSRM
jgi:UDP-N-acetylglucosamine acyltransferase